MPPATTHVVGLRSGQRVSVLLCLPHAALTSLGHVDGMYVRDVEQTQCCWLSSPSSARNLTTRRRTSTRQNLGTVPTHVFVPVPPGPDVSDGQWTRQGASGRGFLGPAVDTFIACWLVSRSRAGLHASERGYRSSGQNEGGGVSTPLGRGDGLPSPEKAASRHQLSIMHSVV